MIYILTLLICISFKLLYQLYRVDLKNIFSFYKVKEGRLDSVTEEKMQLI